VAYEYVENVAVADIAFRVWESDLPHLFTAAADAVMNVMVEHLDSIRPVEQRSLALENDALDMLLFTFLGQLVYYKDSEGLLLRVPQTQIEASEGRYILSGQAVGERLDPERHQLRVDVKAVTLHRFEVKETDRGSEAFVVLDI
jgi:SHS2 domain-containing protein